MNFGTKFPYKRLFTKHKFRENRHSDTCTLLRRRKFIYILTFSMSWPIRVKFGIGDLDVMLLRICEFREIRWIESHILYLMTSINNGSNFLLIIWLEKKICTDTDKNVLRDGEFRENLRNISHTFLSGLNKFLLILFACNRNEYQEYFLEVKAAGV